MITVEDQFLIEKPIGEVWAFFDDFEGLATCVPSLKEFQITGPQTIEGKVGVTLGAIPVTSKVRMDITLKRAPECIQAKGISYLGETISEQLAKDPSKYQATDTGQIYMHLDLRPESDATTRIMFCAGVEAEGKLRKMYESIMRLKVPAMKQEFQHKVGAALSAPCHPISDAHTMCADIEAVKSASSTTVAETHAHVHAAAPAGWWSRFTIWIKALFGKGEAA
jgi:carbon monoxide dehydrogenase subunit G